MAESWSREENEALVSEYLRMLQLELAGVPFVKAEHNRALQALTGRSEGAIEFKLANLSAVLVEQGYAFIDGYKPRSNYQSDLAAVAIERLLGDESLATTMRAAAEAPIAAVPDVANLLDRLVAPPDARDLTPRRISERPWEEMPARHINWLQVESHNRTLGSAGEQFVMAYERARLMAEGKDHLADRVEHVSATRGDGMGFDVLSFEANGTDRLIEVKTTSFAKETPFFLSRNEVDVSDRYRDRYRLYRLFKFRTDPRLYELRGALADACALDAISYRALPR
jgi:hypothetical protein